MAIFLQPALANSYTEPLHTLHSLAEPPDFSVLPGADPSYNHSFTLAELQETHGICKDGTPGSDGISYQIISHLHLFASEFLSLCNRIWVVDVFLPALSTALIVPIPKPGNDMTLATNHMPIALTCYTCKIMERMVANLLLSTLETIQVFSFQFGFRKHRSMLDPLRLDHCIQESFTDKMVLVVFFFL